MDISSLLPRPERVGKLDLSHPDQDDVVVRSRCGNPHTVYVLGTPTAPDQFSLPTREEAVMRALAFARRQHVRAWFENGDHTFVLLGTYRADI